MYEITCDVYDIFHPSPASLKDLSAIAISLDLWRSKKIKSRTRGKSKASHFVLPDLPSTIRKLIDEFTTRFRLSIDHWLRNHSSEVSDFDDFVVDFNGSIHYVRTAERMMRCDRISVVEKFKIACTCYFEDDIRRIWPSVCKRAEFSFHYIDFERSPHVYYWLCYLRNQLSMIPVPWWMNQSFVDVMLDRCMPDNRPSVEYFWARLPLERQLRKACDMYRDRKKFVSFVRFVLPKLDDQRLGEFVKANGYQLMNDLLKGGFAYEWLCLPTWMLIANKMIQISQLKNLVLDMLRFKGDAFADHLTSEHKYWYDFCSTVWNSIPDDGKRSIAGDILSDIELFENMYRRCHITCCDCDGFLYPRLMTLLLGIVSCATSEQRCLFWHNCWSILIRGSRVEDLHRMMKLCFGNDDKMTRFKDKNMANSDHLCDRCVKLLMKANFNQLNGLIDFCFPDTRKGTIFKEQLLRSTLHREDPCYGVVFFRILETDLSKLKEFSAFIDSAFESVDISAAFKNKLMSTDLIQKNIPCSPCLPSAYRNVVMELVETFVTSKRIAKVIKAIILDRLRADPCWKKHSLDRVLLWCLGSEEKVANFKRFHYRYEYIYVCSVSDIESVVCQSDSSLHENLSDLELLMRRLVEHGSAE